MDIKQLQYFDEVAKTRKMSVAANKLYISQQGLSMAIGRLENELSCRLLKRTPEGLTLTPEGEYLAENVKDILDKFEEIEDHYKKAAERQTSIWISASFGAMPEFLGRKLVTFQKKYPGYRVEIDEVDHQECDDNVREDKAELGLSISPIGPEFDSVEVFSSPHCLIVHKGHPWADRKSISIRELDNVPIMTMNSRAKSNQILNEYCASHGIKLNTFYLAGEIVAIHRLVAMGAGIGISVVSVVESFKQPEIVAIPFEEEELMWRLNVIKLKGNQLTKGASLLWNHLVQK